MDRWNQYYKLKALPRSGWLRKIINQPETVAAHRWGLALLCMEYGPQIDGLNMRRVLELALVHDLPEVTVGDITPHDGVSIEDKHRLERTAAHTILSELMLAIWLEYDEHQTLESQFVHTMDKIDMAIQSTIYAKEDDTQEFLNSAWQKIPSQWQWIWIDLQLPIA